MIPSSVDMIRGTAFGDWTLLYVESGSYAEQYARENGCFYDVIGENNPHIEETDLSLLVYHAESDHIVIDGCTEKCKALKFLFVPEFIDGLPVTEIGFGAFDLCECRKVILPSQVNKIGDGAFGCCHYLEKINLPEGLTEIGEEAFREDGELKEIQLPNSLKRIGWGAFILCRQLERLELSDSIEFIGKDAFYSSPQTSGELPLLIVKAGSYAESYVKDNHLNFELKDPSSETTDPAATSSTTTTTTSSATTTTTTTAETTQTSTTTETTSYTGSTSETTSETSPAATTVGTETTILTESTDTTSNLPQTGTASTGDSNDMYIALLLLVAGVWLMVYSSRRT
jgi:hypothetical protein